jgi:hypothetical protein
MKFSFGSRGRLGRIGDPSPSIVRIEGRHAGGDAGGVRAQILFVDVPLVIDQKRHDPRPRKLSSSSPLGRADHGLVDFVTNLRMDKAVADVRTTPFRASQLPVGRHLVRLTRMAAAIGQAVTLGRRPHRNTVDVPPLSSATSDDSLTTMNGISSGGQLAQAVSQPDMKSVSRCAIN